MARDRKRSGRPHRSEEGFTLLEVVVAMACFLIATLALSALTVTNWRGVTKAKTLTEASILDGKVLESLFSRPYNDSSLSDGTHAFTVNDYNGTYYQGTYTVATDAILPQTKLVQVNVSYPLNGSVKNIHINYLLPNRVQ